MLRQLLYKLSLEHVIQYVPTDCADVIFLHHDRLMPGNVDLQKEKYDFLKQSYHERACAITEYASQSEMCRSRFLLNYFGQEESIDCQTCDICRSKANPIEAVRAYAAAHPGFTLEEFVSYCGNPANHMPPGAVSAYRRLLDEGEL